MLIYHPTLKCFDWCAADIFARIIFLFLFPIDIGTFASFLQRKHDEYWIHYWIQTKIFNKYVMYFFRLYYHSTNPLQGDFYSPLPMSRKEKKKIMQRQASSANWHRIRNILPFETIMFYMDVVDQIFKNAFTNRSCKHHFDVQWWSSSLLYPSLWLFEMMLRLLINTKSQW